MAPEPRSRRLVGAVLASALAAVCASPAHALRIVDWNILNYPGTTGPARDPSYRTVLAPLSVDVLVTEETTSQAGVTEFLNSLNTMEPGQWAAAPFVDGNDTDAGLFYKPAKVNFIGQRSFYPNAASLLRLVHMYRIKPVGYAADAAEIDLFAVHLKASTGFESQRLAEATGLRDSMNALAPGTHAMVLGDFNFYTGTEPAMTKFLESQVDNDGRLYDPLGLQGVSWQDNTSIQSAWTQSTCKTGDTGCANGAATGGLDDRFDLILPTYALKDGVGIELISGSYISVGNDGLHHNNSIQDPPTIPEGAAYATALHSVSDHLPVRLDLQVPSKISASGPLTFGTVIVSAVASQNLSITNPATIPADGLDYSFTAPAGFSAPGGSFTLGAGAPAAVHAITMNTGAAGNLAGNLSIASDDPDHPTTLVALSGTVLDHAQASLDSSDVSLAATLDFGEHAASGFPTLETRVHNYAYNALQARVALSGGAITGGAGRFSIAGGFSPALLAGTGQSFDLAFDDAGATPDSTYDAALTFTSADEALPGAQPRPDLVITLHARLSGGNVAVGDHAAPGETRLLAPYPNPLAHAATLRFDLARAAHVRLEVFDLHGRRVATVADRAYDPGRYGIDWNGRGANGAALGAGLYFVRLSGPGLHTQSARLAIVR
jgi:flagellar hook capping protein FlgD